MGVVLRRYIDFLILLIPTPLVSVLFCSSIPTFCSFFYNYYERTILLTLGGGGGYAQRRLCVCLHKREIPTDSSQYGNHFKKGDFCKNVSFKCYGVIC